MSLRPLPDSQLPPCQERDSQLPMAWWPLCYKATICVEIL